MSSAYARTSKPREDFLFFATGVFSSVKTSVVIINTCIYLLKHLSFAARISTDFASLCKLTLVEFTAARAAGDGVVMGEVLP